MAVLYLVLGLLMFISLVVLHEAGHAYAARRNNVDVEEFGIGFPPRFWSRKLKNGMVFSLNLLPLGGFVRLKGEHDAASGKGTYGSVSLWAKTQILLAGVLVNWIIAALIFTILALVGLPQVLPNQFTVTGDTSYAARNVVASDIVVGSPAAKAGIKANDYILSLNGQKITSSAQLADLTSANAGKTVDIVVDRSGLELNKAVILNPKSVEGMGYAGIGMGEVIQRRSTWSAPVVGSVVTVQFTWETLKGLGHTVQQLFNRQFQAAGQNVTGPVGIFTILDRSSQLGFVPVLFLIGIISMTLAVMNVLPIPALDGGRLFITLVAHGLRRPLSKEREEAIQAIGFAALMVLVLVITVVDVGRIFGK